MARKSRPPIRSLSSFANNCLHTMLRTFSTRTRLRRPEVLTLLIIAAIVLQFLPWTRNDGSIQGENQQWWWTSHDPRPTAPRMTVIILSMDRFDSLQRLISSLQESKYDGDVIDLVVRFDRPDIQHQRPWLQRVREFRNSLRWKHGNIRIAIANKTLGLAESWFRAWSPASDYERAVIFEDDLEVSPIWYQWLKKAHDMYAGNRDDLAAFSLSHQHLVPLKASNKTAKEFPDDEPFMYALLGSHGFSPLAKIWKEFLEFVHCTQRRGDNVSIATPELITSDWYHNVVSKQSMWTQHFIYFTKHHNLYNIYQFPRDKVLTAHWQEKGAHFDGKTRRRNYPLVQDGDIDVDFPLDLKKYDWGANLVRVDTTPVLPPVVMSVAIGYSLDRFEAFVGSLRQVYSGDVWLLISGDASVEVRDFLRLHRVKTVETKGSLAAPASKEWDNINRSRFRFFVYVCNSSAYSLCLTTDFRDSLFQADPFQSIDPSVMKSGAPGVLFLHEHNTDMNDYHYDLMRSKSCGLYENYATFLRGTKIINGGSIIGSPGAFQQLADYITDKFKGCNDQVTMNVVVRADLLQNISISIHGQGEGGMNIVGYGGEVIKDSSGKFLNKNCLVSPVVHQYDII
ncbi:family 2 glycosyl transferase [Nitzschia inconspicua]|uniref:Family 2 glycosyl transferase n=1 Tax=Nitzschia inconspicua TaxID=303405 RepID=A0A9K3LIW4_9STRA|nr:family 2 glycosyl transferase [Nitzschia inconspicua]